MDGWEHISLCSHPFCLSVVPLSSRDEVDQTFPMQVVHDFWQSFYEHGQFFEEKNFSTSFYEQGTFSVLTSLYVSFIKHITDRVTSQATSCYFPTDTIQLSPAMIHQKFSASPTPPFLIFRP